MSDMSGMDDMSSTSGSMGDMKMYFHGSIGSDYLWFASWVPTSAGATVGVCIALVVIAIFERYLVAFRRACDVAWQRGQLGYTTPTTTGPYIYPPEYSDSIDAPQRPRAYDTSSTPTPSDSESIIPAPINPYAHASDRRDSDPGEKGREEDGIAHFPRAVRIAMNPDRRGRWSRPFRWGVDVPRGFLQAAQTLLHYVLMLVVMSFNIWWVLSVVVGAGIGEMLFGRFGAGGAEHRNAGH